MKPWKVLAFCLVLSSAATAFAGERAGDEPTVRQVLWRDPGAVEARDVLWGSGSESRQPAPPFKLVKENLKGASPKVRVTDARGMAWDVKFGVEAHAEVIANRLLWALGYMAQDMYYVPQGTIEGATGLQRAGKYVHPDGSFTEARFRPRGAEDEIGGWALTDNPFLGQRELSGLVILMALLNNWDTEKDNNTRTFRVRAPAGIEDWYLVKDLGASFGRFVGPKGTPIKWHLPSYQQDPLIAKVEDGTVHLVYPAYGKPPTTVPLEHARWFADLVGRLSPEQVRRAFEAGGATPAETAGFSAKLAAKIAELRAAAGESPRAADRAGEPPSR